MFRGMVRSVLSTPGPACFGKKSGFSDYHETGTNGAGFSDLVIYRNKKMIASSRCVNRFTMGVGGIH